MPACILCKAHAIINRQESASRTIYNCSRCGVFVVSDLVEKEVNKSSSEIASYLMTRKLANESDTVLISFEKANLDKEYLQMTVDKIVGLYPKSFEEQMGYALRNLGRMSKFPGHEIRIEDVNFSPILFVKNNNVEALTFLLKSMQKAELVENNYFSGAYFPCGVTVSVKGWERIYQMKNGLEKRDNLFVCAPREDNEVSTQFHTAMKKLAKECDLHMVENSNVRAEAIISNELVAGVKAGKVVVCDFTEGLGEAYFASALAMGLKNICVLTCHESAKKKLQFDRNHLNVIIWDKPESLYLEVFCAIKARL